MNYWDSTLTIEDWDQQGVTHFNIDLDDVFDCDYADVVSMMEYACPHLIKSQEQVQLERDAISQGLKKLHDNTEQLEKKQYASASVYGVASIDVLIPLLVERIKRTTDYAIYVVRQV